MAYGLKYRNKFEGINDLTNVKYNVLLEIFQDGYVGAVTEIEELDKNPLQFRLDNSGDTHFVPIKKTSVSINIVDTGQFDYSEFYTSNAKKYKVVITSPVLNWQGYLVPQSYNSNLNYRQPFTLTASDGLHLLSSIDYVPDQSKTVTLAGFIADIENRIGLGTFDRTTTIQTEIGNVWDALIYEGMFTDLNYEEALEMVLKSIGMQLRYWKIFPVIESYNVTNNADVQIINKDISLSFLAPIKTAKVTQEITTLPDLMLNGMVDDLSDLVESNVGHVLPFDTLSKWVAHPTAGGVIVNRGRSRSTSDRDTSDYYTAINLELMPINGVKESFELTGNEISYFVCRPVNATALTFSIKANFGKVAYFSGRGSTSGLVNSKLYTAKYVELKYGIYDEISNKSFNYTTMSWDITGRPTQAKCNKLRITDPKDGDTTIYIETPATTGTTTKVNFYLLGGSVEYVDTMLPAVAQTMVKNILSIDAIEVDGVSLVSDKELYNETSSVVDVAPNIDVLDYDISFGYCPSPPANTSLYYGSAFYHTNLAQIINVVVQGNTIPWLQYIYQTLLYTQNVQRKKVYTCSLLLKSVVNPIWLRTTLMGDVVMTNSLTFDWKTSQISAELTEIMPYVYLAWNITSESTIGSSDWGGSGGQTGTSGGGGTVDTSNFVVKTGATDQIIEGIVRPDNLLSNGAVVAKSLAPTDVAEWPQAGQNVDGVVRYDNVTIKRNANGQLYVVTSGGTVVSFGTEVAGQSVQLIVAAINKTLALASHTHTGYQPADADLTAIAALAGTSGFLKKTALNTWALDTATYGLSSADITGVTLTSSLLTLARSAGNLTASIPTWNQNTTGSAAKLTTPVNVNVSISGVNGTAQGFDGSAPITIPVTLKTLTRGSYLTGNNFNGGTDTTWSVDAASTNTASKVVARDANGDFAMRDLSLRNGYADGALVAKYLSSTYSQDWPIAGSAVYGTIKYDPATLSLNGSGQLTVIGGGGSNVAWGSATSQYAQLNVDGVAKSLSLDGHTHSQYLLSSAYTAADVLSKLLTVDGDGSGLDADLLDGLQPNQLAVLSATKLSNTRTIWGQSFDGTGNVDGPFRNIISTSYLISHKTLKFTSNPYGLITRIYDDGKVGLQVQRESNDSETFNLLLNQSGGNVLVGTATDAGYKLDVNGSGRFLGRLYAQAGLSVIGTNTNSYTTSVLIGNTVSRTYYVGAGIPNAHEDGFAIMDYTNSKQLMYFDSNGNCTIGTHLGAGYKLDVNGTFRAVGAGYFNSTLNVTTSVTSPSFIGNASTATKLNSVRTFALTGDVAGTITSDLASGVSIATTIQPNSVALGTDTTGNYAGSVLVSGNGLSITGVAGEGTAFTVVSNATSLNTASTIMFRDASGDYHARNGLHDGTLVAKYLSSSYTVDWPVMTASVLGVAKASGLAVYPTAGDLALRVEHYTTTTTNSWQNKAYSISMDIPITSPASLAANSYHSSTFLYALPTNKCLSCQVTVIPYATGTTPPWIGMQLIASVAKDSTGYWRVFVYNPTSSAVDLTNVHLSIIAQMIE